MHILLWSQAIHLVHLIGQLEGFSELPRLLKENTGDFLISPNPQEEFVSFQLLNDLDIPTEIWDAARVGGDENMYYSIDVLRTYICNIEYRFARLSKVATTVLVISHSNASKERIFSVVRKNKTPVWALMAHCLQ